MSFKDAISRGAALAEHLWLGRPDCVIYFRQGIGDELLCTAVARELKKRGARKIIMSSKIPELFEENPDIAAVRDIDYASVGRFRHWGFGAVVPQYGVYDPVSDRDLTLAGHYIETMCRIANLTGEIDLRPYLFLRPGEREKGCIYPAQAAILSAGQAIMKNKQWPVERYQAVVDALQNEVQWIQIGLPDSPPIRGALDLRGKTSLRETAAILANSQVFLGEAGFVMHAARAVECRSVIVYGGREDPAISGYSANENMVGRTVCSPCWQRIRCDFGLECMQIITTDEVIGAVRRQIERAGSPLPVDRVTIPVGSPHPVLPKPQTPASAHQGTSSE
jgi:ADP-heptose:LPS heptosyltransferase